jgi:hypothetical protein
MAEARRSVASRDNQALPPRRSPLLPDEWWLDVGAWLVGFQVDDTAAVVGTSELVHGRESAVHLDYKQALRLHDRCDGEPTEIVGHCHTHWHARPSGPQPSEADRRLWLRSTHTFIGPFAGLIASSPPPRRWTVGSPNAARVNGWVAEPDGAIVESKVEFTDRSMRSPADVWRL